MLVWICEAFTPQAKDPQADWNFVFVFKLLCFVKSTSEERGGHFRKNLNPKTKDSGWPGVGWYRISRAPHPPRTHMSEGMQVLSRTDKP